MHVEVIDISFNPMASGVLTGTLGIVVMHITALRNLDQLK